MTNPSSNLPGEFAGMPVLGTDPEQNTWGLCIGIYGKGGVGKTHLAGTIVDSSLGSPAVVLDAEAGSSVLEGKAGIQRIKIDSWQQLQTFGQAARQAGRAFPWRTVVLDNYSEIQELELATHGQGQPELRDYNLDKIALLRLARFWRDFSRQYGVNVIITFWEDIDKEESSGRWVYRLGLTPKVASILPGILDIVGYLTVDERSQVRTLNFAPSPRLATKFRRPQNSRAQAIPLTIAKPNLGELLDVLKGGATWNAKAHEVAQVKTSNDTKEQ